MSEGYIRIPRSFLRDSLWTNLNNDYKHIFLTILDHVVYKPQRFDNHGTIIELQPGQVCLTERQIVDLCDCPSINKSKVHRALVKFQDLKFLAKANQKSNQKSNQRKSVLGITRRDLLELIEQKSNQERTTKEESNNLSCSVLSCLKPSAEKEKDILIIKSKKDPKKSYKESHENIFKHFRGEKYRDEDINEAIARVKSDDTKINTEVIPFLKGVLFNIANKQIVKQKYGVIYDSNKRDIIRGQNIKYIDPSANGKSFLPEGYGVAPPGFWDPINVFAVSAK